MIEPQIHNGQRGVIGQQHGLQKLTETLDSLTTGQTLQQQRDTALQAQLATLTQQLATLTTRGRQLVVAIGALGLLTLGLAGIGGWQVMHPPDTAYVRALGAVDGTLAQSWNALPKATQEQLNSTYSRVGLASPGQRK